MYHHVLFFQITVYCVFFATEGVCRSIARGVLLGIVGGDVRPVLQILTRFQTKKM